jgi:hypothetical protein
MQLECSPCQMKQALLWVASAVCILGMEYILCVVPSFNYFTPFMLHVGEETALAAAATMRAASFRVTQLKIKAFFFISCTILCFKLD